jgi:uncharacterized membrane protein YphA (DoxX/SURF4 family)
LTSQFILGGIFIIAGLAKITDTDSFILTIQNFKILPGYLIEITAYALPLVEISFGLTLILGVYTRFSAIVLSSLLVLFIIVISINIIRGINVNCGCFFKTLQDSGKSKLDQFLLILRDILFLFPGIIIIFLKKNNK